MAPLWALQFAVNARLTRTLLARKSGEGGEDGKSGQTSEGGKSGESMARGRAGG